jgi:hypothetical protein
LIVEGDQDKFYTIPHSEMTDTIIELLKQEATRTQIS